LIRVKTCGEFDSESPKAARLANHLTLRILCHL